MINLTNYSKLEACNFELVQDGIANITYKADSNKGKIIIRKSKTPGAKDPTFEVNLIDFLDKKGINVPTIIANDFGNLYSNDEEGSCVTVFSFIEGQTLDNSLETRKKYAHKAGETLANFHVQALDFSQKNFQRTLYSEIESGIDNKDKLVELFPNESTEFLANLDKAISIVNQPHPKEYLSVLHNDFRPQNIIVDLKDDFSIIDFDWATPGPIQKDIALALLEWGRADNESEFNKEIIKKFLAGYNKISPLPLSFNKEIKDWMFVNAMSDATSFILYRIKIGNPASPNKSFMYQKAVDIFNI